MAAPDTDVRQLAMSANLGDIDSVERLISTGIPIDSLTDLGTDWIDYKHEPMTALMYASRAGNVEIVKLLIQSGAQVNLANATGQTALMFAAEAGQLNVVKLFLSTGAHREALNQNGWSAAMKAARRGHSQILRHLEGGNVSKHLLGPSILWASEMGRNEQVDFYIRSGVDVNFVGEDGYSALMIASEKCHSSIASILIRHGAKVNVVDSLYQVDSPLSLAVQNNCADIVRALLDSKADPNFAVQSDATPILSAIAKDNIDLVSLLVKHGASLHGEDGVRALLWAIERRSLRIVEQLVGYGVQVNTTSCGEDSPVMIASTNGYAEIVKYLVKQGADVNSACKSGTSSPLVLATINGHSGTVGVLLEAGASVNQRTADGSTPILLASSRGDLKSMALLLSAGADCTISNNWGESVFAVAKNEDALTLLKKRCRSR